MTKLISLFVSLICCATFIYQLGSVTRDYLQYQTITKVEYRLNEAIELPAFTVAFETPIPMFDLWHEAFPDKHYPHKIIEDEYWSDSVLGDHCANISEIHRDSWEDDHWKNEENSEVWECFLHYYNNPLVKHYLSELDLYHGDYFSCESQDVNRASECANVSLCDPELASYSIGHKGFIGVTQFSKLDSCLNLSTEAIVEVGYKYSKILPFKKWSNLVQMHGAKHVPDYSRAQKLDLTCDQIVRYHRVTFKRLPSPFDTDCHDFEKNPLNSSRSQSQCLANCLFAAFKEDIVNGSAFNGYFRRISGYFIEKEQFSETARMSDVFKDRDDTKELTKEWLKQLKRDCKTACPVDCEDIMYDWAVSLTQSDHSSTLTIMLKHDYDKDQAYSHLPAIDWLGFLADFDGLVGMWTGFSVLSC